MLSLDLMLQLFLIPVHSDTLATLLYLWVFLHFVMETSRKCIQTTKRHLKIHMISHQGPLIQTSGCSYTHAFGIATLKRTGLEPNPTAP